MTQVIKKMYEEKLVQRIKGNPGSYWVKSSRFRQLYYKVTLIPQNDICKCTCKAFQFDPSKVCKHILQVVEIENGGRV